jgi:hypothetical protein
MITNRFQIDPIKCYYEYKAIKESVGQEFLDFTGSMKMIDQALNYDYLTSYGKKELEFIMMYMHQKLSVQRVQFLGHLANILIIFIPPCEVFHVLRKLTHESAAIKGKGDQGRLRWFVPLDADDQSTLISSFVDLYLNLTEN